MSIYASLRKLVGAPAGPLSQRRQIAARGPLGPGDIERVRFPGEDAAAARLRKSRRFARVLSARRSEALLRSDRFGALVSEMRLDRGEAPGFLFEALDDARRLLGVSAQIDVYQSGGPLGARLRMHGERVAISLGGPVFEILNKQELRGLFGFQLGRLLAHAAPSARLRDEHLVAQAMRGSQPFGDQEPEWLAACAFLVAAEITADRFELLVSRDLDAYLTGQLKFWTHLGDPALAHDPGAVLRQMREALDESVGQGVRGLSQPERHVRVRAAELFFESDLFRALSGKGPGTRPIAEVNLEIGRLLLGWAPRGADTIEQGRFEEFLLAAASAIARADGVVCKEERAYLAMMLPAAWRDALPEPAEAELLLESFADAVKRGDDTRARLSTLNFLSGLIDADGRSASEELLALDAIGRGLGSRELFRQQLLHRYGFDPVAYAAEAGRAPGAGGSDASPALARYLHTVHVVGRRSLSLRKLLRLAGFRRRTPRALERLMSALFHHEVRARRDLSAGELDARVTLESLRAREGVAPRAGRRRPKRG